MVFVIEERTSLSFRSIWFSRREMESVIVSPASRREAHSSAKRESFCREPKGRRRKEKEEGSFFSSK
ncbi:hypothetical protein [uncultured Dialister sp.]|uniref:hypothetical protein n=1 Tax=uncultured Dialister sp. TaxID=278064 RepID=UPI00265F7E27|nr:hypothetical protein [uncultured Dialister sp.]